MYTFDMGKQSKTTKRTRKRGMFDYKGNGEICRGSEKMMSINFTYGSKL